MQIASWNVNSLNVRLPHLVEWLGQRRPDIVGIQETKLEDDRFPEDALLELGYRSVFAGQKTYNGVALLSRLSAQDVQIGVPGLDDPQRRAIAASYADADGGSIRVLNLYVVNGKAVGDEKYDYKLRWLSAVRDWIADELSRHPRLVVVGDFNIAPDDRDVHDPAAWAGEILCSEPERRALDAILELGLHDSFRLHCAENGHFTWWDYRAAGFRRNLGLRIDLVLVSEALRARCQAAGIDREPRTWERPSDHTPVWAELAA